MGGVGVLTPDRLAEITARRAERWDADQTTLRAWADIDWLVSEVERLRGLLGRLEWAGATYGDESACPNDECCMTPREGHVPGCWLAAELRSRP